MTESKKGMWDQIEAMKASNPIIAAAFELHGEGMIEDKEGILMRAVVMMDEQIKRLETTQQNLLQARYKRVS